MHPCLHAAASGACFTLSTNDIIEASAYQQNVDTTRPDIHAKFVELEWAQRHREREGNEATVNNPSKWSRLSGDAVTARNRYGNVEPYASNRIKLKVKEGYSDYINASPIQLGKRKYIATQGPKDVTVNHFYRMLAQEIKSPAVVVMLTATHEPGKEKCYQYYPLSQEESPLILSPDDYDEDDDGWEGEVHLESVQNDPKSGSEIRRLRLRTKTQGEQEQELEIRHLFFPAWPDFHIPEGEDRAPLIQLIRLSAAFNQPPSSANGANGNVEVQPNGMGPSIAHDMLSTDPDNPRVIHCSAGVGRSGTFIAMDYLLSLMYSNQLDNIEDDKDPIAETVDGMRQQRMMMVQGESQFNFLYEIMREQMVARMQAQDELARGGAEQGEA